MYFLKKRKFQGKAGSTSRRSRRVILLDSSILMYAVKGKKKLPINIEEALREVSEGAELAVLDTTINELQFLKEKAKGKTRIAADFALEFIDRLNIRIIHVSSRIIEDVSRELRRGKAKDFHDEILIRAAKKLNAAVATVDFGLVKKLRKNNVTCYFLSGRNWIMISGYFD